MPPRIKLVTFDALHTLITPRLPIAVQYAQTFEPYLGPLDPKLLNLSFKRALKDLQKSKPLYASPSPSPSPSGTSEPSSQNASPDPTSWWTEIIRRTALGAHASPALVSQHLQSIVPVLMKRFSSDEGYMLFDDVVPSLQELKRMGVKTGIITNADSRIRDPEQEQPLILVSELLGIEKPSPRIFELACTLAGVKLEEGLHVGDEVDACVYLSLIVPARTLCG
ncbi:uncharacterized protein STEHIDRAFT_68915 [Stereum hirsutum FP-91666 SS1]|uniref:HAD-like protein n=1 Tax=Stereum hirsutum (strain FP-91666) TaxID=721885 RepID=R7RYL1_STEHR|nr:uncharacterized protein STEHIDRAFT_68915 [Stereum hirsutum FP-91666 SS1]EIM79908.1 hypothetical protein STEHIDRAFT_68915 [Stereum hirsutum FP-91666 SS1]